MISSNRRTSAVTEISASARTSAGLPNSTINPLPVNGTSVNTSTWRNSNALRPLRRKGKKSPGSAAMLTGEGAAFPVVAWPNLPGGVVRLAAESFTDGRANVPGGVAGPVGRVVVVGAGIAGSTVASALTQAGVERVALEARDRIGGRMAHG